MHPVEHNFRCSVPAGCHIPSHLIICLPGQSKIQDLMTQSNAISHSDLIILQYLQLLYIIFNIFIFLVKTWLQNVCTGLTLSSQSSFTATLLGFRSYKKYIYIFEFWKTHYIPIYVHWQSTDHTHNTNLCSIRVFKDCHSMLSLWCVDTAFWLHQALFLCYLFLFILSFLFLWFSLSYFASLLICACSPSLNVPSVSECVQSCLLNCPTCSCICLSLHFMTHKLHHWSLITYFHISSHYKQNLKRHYEYFHSWNNFNSFHFICTRNNTYVYNQSFLILLMYCYTCILAFGFIFHEWFHFYQRPDLFCPCSAFNLFVHSCG